MPKFMLPSGREVTLGVMHGQRPSRDGMRRFTKIRLTLPMFGDLEAVAVCSPLDNFCRRTGRKLAVKHLFEKAMRLAHSKELTSAEVLPKEDRAAIFFRVCPEYSQTQTP